MKKATRSYTQQTLKILFSLSGNECAAPDCTVSVVIPATDKSQAQILGHICHIYSFAENGPRGKAGLTEEDINSHENLIVLCPNHHTVVDRQPETYPARTLKKWKETHEGRIRKDLREDLASEQADVIYYPVDLVDTHIKNEIGQLRKSQFFVEIDRVNTALTLARQLLEGELRGGTDSVRSWALTWCARMLTADDRLDEAEEFLKQAKHLGGDKRIAQALILSRRGDKSASLDALVDIDSLDSRTATLMVAGHHDGPQGVIDWLKSQEIEASEIDPDGKHILIRNLLELRQWEAAYETANALTEHELEKSPILHFAKAMSYLLRTIPVELRHVVISQIPFEAASLSLDSSRAAVDARRTAFGHFVSATEFAVEFRCPRAAAIAESYALWLELEDPENGKKGRKRLAAKLDELRTALHLVPLGLQYGIPLDQAEIEQEIERQDSSGSGIALDMAFARLALARMQERPKDIANYISCHYDMLSAHLDAKAIRSIQIEMLAKAGQTELAKEYLEELREAGLSEVEEGRLRIATEKAEGKDTLEARKMLFEVSGSIVDLEALVSELGTKEDWGELSNYGEVLFEETNSLQDAERLTNALHFAGKSARVIDLLEANDDILSQSTNLKMCYCWALFHEGEMLRAHHVLSKLEVDWEDESYRTLQIKLAVALGDWDSLSASIASGYRQTENKSARELVMAAELSLYLNLRSAKELLFAGAEMGKDDADVLSHAYFLATRAGWEADEKVAYWLHRAVELSGEDGPLWTVTANDILDLKPEWDRQEFSIRQLLNRGETPMFFAAQFLNKSLIDLTLFPALANSEERDPRRRVGIPAFSGQRQPTQLMTGGTIGLDYTTLLTLSFLNLLDKVIDAYDTVYVPHSTLAWLFEERQNASFHQPSRIEDARKVLDMLTADSLEKLSPSTAVDRELSVQVGDDLAMLIAEVENSTNESTQRLVVRPSPVYKVVSLGKEEADLTGHAAVLSSCQAVVRKLRQSGEIDELEEKDALAHLQLRLREKPWPQQPEISDRAILYLDDLAVYYLLHTGILDKLRRAKFRSFVSPRLISESNALIAYERISGDIIDSIEKLRSVVSRGIESRKVKFGKWRSVDNWEEQSIFEHHIAGVKVLTEKCDAIIADDRFLNQCPRIEHNEAEAPLFSTLDLLDALETVGSITPVKRLEYRTKLRRAGYFFLPVSDDELTYHLNAATVSDKKLNETAELRAIRESVLRVRMSDWLQLPQEATWPVMTEKAFVRALRTSWRGDAELSGVIARSNWIVDQLSIENGDIVLKGGRGPLILVLLVPLPDAPLEIWSAYRDWAEDRILAPIKDLYPELYAWIVANYKARISELANQEQIGGLDMANIPNAKVQSARALLDLAPSLIRETLLEDMQFRDEFGFQMDALLVFDGSGASFTRSELYGAIRRTLSGESNLTVTDTEGREWRLSDEGEGS